MVERRDLAHRAQNPHGHRQIEAGALLAHVGRREIDGHGLIRIAEAGIDERGFDALTAFAHRRIRHPDHNEVARRAGRVHVDFDVDQVRVDAIDGGAAGFE